MRLALLSGAWSMSYPQAFGLGTKAMGSIKPNAELPGLGNCFIWKEGLMRHSPSDKIVPGGFCCARFFWHDMAWTWTQIDFRVSSSFFSQFQWTFPPLVHGYRPLAVAISGNCICPHLLWPQCHGFLHEFISFRLPVSSMCTWLPVDLLSCCVSIWCHHANLWEHKVSNRCKQANYQREIALLSHLSLCDLSSYTGTFNFTILISCHKVRKGQGTAKSSTAFITVSGKIPCETSCTPGKAAVSLVSLYFNKLPMSNLSNLSKVSCCFMCEIQWLLPSETNFGRLLEVTRHLPLSSTSPVEWRPTNARWGTRMLEGEFGWWCMLVDLIYSPTFRSSNYLAVNGRNWFGIIIVSKTMNDQMMSK